jgi:hypothetical protein
MVARPVGPKIPALDKSRARNATMLCASFLPLWNSDRHCE